MVKIIASSAFLKSAKRSAHSSACAGERGKLRPRFSVLIASESSSKASQWAASALASARRRIRSPRQNEAGM